MKQNVMDDESVPVFDDYFRMYHDNTGLNLVLEQPAIRRCLPSLAGKVVLDLGCGFGTFCRYARAEGAASVTGVDLSKRMIAQATRESEGAGIRFVHSAVEDYDFASGRSDVVVSSLAFHMMQDLASLLGRIRDHLLPGGYLVYSVPHPIRLSRARGWFKDDGGVKLFMPVDSYKEEGVRDCKWGADTVYFYHRTLETQVNGLLDAGFTLRRLLEPEALPEFVAERPELLEERRAPPFLVLAAQLPG